MIAHPGHEVCIAHWVERRSPHLVVLTTGSRSGADRGRIEHIIASNGMRRFVPTALIGSFEDRQLYRLIMEGDSSPFHDWADKLRDALIAAQASEVVVDAWQGYSVAHDLTNLLARVAAAEASCGRAEPIRVLEFAPVSEAAWPRRVSTPIMVEENLTPAEVAQKIRAAQRYPDLSEDLVQFLDSHRPEDLAREALYDAPSFGGEWRPAAPPYYERVGEQRARAGIYTSVLRFSHFAVVAKTLVERLQLAAANLEKMRGL
ncbi:hypothetical protein sos41_28900 [Alphaproteobacteria bacterium SO-S41]|nr:hypothetical protein sos41_28900 [Alphaproteobacteria bacterium SO-S41]